MCIYSMNNSTVSHPLEQRDAAPCLTALLTAYMTEKKKIKKEISTENLGAANYGYFFLK